MNLQFTQDLMAMLNVPQVVDWRRELPVNKNYTWSQLAGTRELNELTTLICHHDSIKKSQSSTTSDLQLATNIANGHIRLTSNEPKGDAGFPYHIWIRNGNVYYCNNIEDRTYGVASHNGYTVHVCVSGEYAFTDQLTDADRKALIAVMVTLWNELPNVQDIKGHGELNPTSCPGYSIPEDDVQTIRLRLDRLKSLEARKERAYAVVNQCLYMWSLVDKNDGNSEWSLNWLDEVHSVMKSKNLL